MKFDPTQGYLLVSPIEDPSEKHFIEVVGVPTSMKCAVVEKKGPQATIKPGDVVYFPRGVERSVILDNSIVYDILHESQVLGVIEDPGEVKRTNVSPEQAKARREKIRQEQEAEQRRADLVTA